MNRKYIVMGVVLIIAPLIYLAWSRLWVPYKRFPVVATTSTSVAVSASAPPPIASSAPVPSEPVLNVLGEFSSLYKTDTGDGRVTNIELGAEKVNDVIVAPGETWSFNDTVGPRTEEMGFKKAPVLIMGEVFQDVGGGMCQVSSTIFAASIRAGLGIEKRLSHSRPSSYIPKGMDATVNYPEQCWGDKQDPNICFDLKLQNIYDFPVKFTISTESWDADKHKLPKNLRPGGHYRRLTVRILGSGKAPVVNTKWVTYGTPDFKRRWRRGWKPGEWKRKAQSGRPGLRGALIVDTTWPDGHKTQDLIVSTYKPVDEVWWVGRNWQGGDPWE